MSKTLHKPRRKSRAAVPTAAVAPRASRWAPWGVFAASLFVVIAFLTLLPARYAVNEATDFQYFYQPVANRIVNGEGLVTPSGVASRYPPGYPIIVAAFYELGASDAFVNHYSTALFTAATAAILFAFGRSAFGSLAGYAAAALWITYPAALWMSKQPGSEGPFSALLVAVLWLTWTLLLRNRIPWTHALAAGAGFGTLMLIRPIAIGLPLLAAAAVFLLAADPDRRSRLLAAATLGLGALAAILPWEVFVHSHSGSWIPLSTGGAATMRDGLTFATGLKSFRTGAWVPDDVRKLQEDLAARYAELDSPGKIAAILAGEFTRRPAAVTKLMLLKAARSWYGTDSQRLETPLLAIHAVYLAGLAAAFFIAFRRRGAPRTLAWLLLGVVLYFWAMTAIALPVVRYMTPMMTMSFLMMGTAFAALRSCPRASVRVL